MQEFISYRVSSNNHKIQECGYLWLEKRCDWWTSHSFNFPFLKLSRGTQMFKIYSLCLIKMLHILLCVKYFIKQKGKNLLIHFKDKRRYFFLTYRISEIFFFKAQWRKFSTLIVKPYQLVLWVKVSFRMVIGKFYG